jgi:L-ascorbate metabolism protein UlaG (beta-lactamase superfamily)
VPVSIDALPPLDAVVLSHDHYDHLDRGAVVAFAARGERFVAPLGVGAHLERWGVASSRITELDWHESTEVAPGLTVRALPSRHFSGRGPLDRNATLWASYSLEGRSHRVYFGGDGGMDESSFEAIGAAQGPFDLTMLEIGAFDPAWGAIHLGPENALRAHALLRGRTLLPIHWGTFDLGLHAWDAPPEELLAFARERPTTLALPRIGESFVPHGELPREPWWRAVHQAAPVPGATPTRATARAAARGA